VDHEGEFRVWNACGGGRSGIIAAIERIVREEAAMLKAGDRVYIDGTREEGTVKEVHPHEVVVRIETDDGHEDKKYAHEDLRLDPTMKEASNFVDH
jgi:hypothetical protein